MEYGTRKAMVQRLIEAILFAKMNFTQYGNVSIKSEVDDKEGCKCSSYEVM